MTGRPGRHCRPGCSLPLPESLQARGWCETRRTGPGVGNPAGPCGGPGPSPSHGPIRRRAASGGCSYLRRLRAAGGTGHGGCEAGTRTGQPGRGPADWLSDSDWHRLSGPGLRGPGRLGASGVEVPDWQRRGWRAASGGGRHGGRAPGSDRGSAPAEIEPFRDHRAGRTQRGLLKTRRHDASSRGDKEGAAPGRDAADLPVLSYNVAPHPKRNACSFALLEESSLLVCCEGMEEKFSGIARICLAACTPHTFKVTMF